MSKMTWDNIQNQSDEILSDGLFALKSRPFDNFSNVTEKGFGNYLISLDKKPFYIGEAKELSKRIKQQSKSTTSTFYKNYLKATKTNQLLKPVDIDSFKIQFITTNIGRKEIEEFGIVNLPTKLNSFQLDKRKKFEIKNHNGLWLNVQNEFADILKQGETKLFKTTFQPWFNLTTISNAGLYLVKDKSDRLIYIGESSDVGERITTHSGRTYFSALRRHIGTEILGFQLKEINKKKRYFSDSEDKKVTDFIRSCKATVFAVNFGRYELEEYLIKKHRPLLNRKDNKDE
ncbi:GIY-YIG nuclease family protein [Yeosuana sp.]|uniref:GIY-YIG nuclease family protein n=1 Tax=Yeosuana sp. TaxID=2529388 RepID=UPI00404821E5